MSEKSELLLALEVLQKLSWFSFNGEAVQADCLKIERNIDKHFALKSKLRLKTLLNCNTNMVYKYILLSLQILFSSLFTQFVQFLYPRLFEYSLFWIKSLVSYVLEITNVYCTIFWRTPIPLSFRISKLTRW